MKMKAIFGKQMAEAVSRLMMPPPPIPIQRPLVISNTKNSSSSINPKEKQEKRRLSFELLGKNRKHFFYDSLFNEDIIDIRWEKEKL